MTGQPVSVDFLCTYMFAPEIRICQWDIIENEHCKF